MAPLTAAGAGAGALARSGARIACRQLRRTEKFSPGVAARADACQQAACSTERPSSAAPACDPASAMAIAVANQISERLIMACAIEDRRRLVQSRPPTRQQPIALA